MNPADAKKMGKKAGDRVKVVSATNKEGLWDLRNGNKEPMIGKVTETIMPGATTFTPGHGLWATGAADMIIDGKTVKGDPRRATGVDANAAI